MTNIVQIDVDQTFEGLTCREMIQLTRGRLGVGPDDVNRYTDANVVQALNMGQERFAKLTNCLIYPVVIIGRAGRQNYPLPLGTLRVMSARWYTGDGPSDYYDLKILRDARDMQKRDAMYRGTLGDPDFLFPTYRSGNLQMVGVAPIPSYSGNVLINNVPYGKTTVISGFSIAGNIAGEHKAGYAGSAFLVDSLGRDLASYGALVGYPVYNTTQGTSGVITAISNQDSVNDKIVATLSGAGTWTPGDTFQILMTDYGTNIDADADHIPGTQLGVIADVITGQGTIAMDCSKKPFPLSAALDTMVSEIPAAFQEAQIAFATYWLASGMFAGVVQPQKAADGMAIFQRYVDEFNRGDESVEASENMVEQMEW